MTRKGFVGLALVIAVVPALAQAQPIDASRIRSTATRGFAAIQVAQKASQKSQSCTTTCHLQAYGALAYRSAREHGISVEESVVRADLTRAFGAYVTDLNGVVQGNALGEVAMNAGFFLVASRAAGLQPSLITAAAARAIALQQGPDGDWTSLYTRPPSNSSSFTFTALAMRAMQLYRHPSQRTDVSRRMAQANRWLRFNTPRDTEDRVYQLLGLSWAVAERSFLARLAVGLIGMQRADGGWNSIEGGESNAYATGQALVALHDAGGVATTDPVWQRGLEFLLRTQAADGTWRVPTRLPAFISPPYFESGYPYDRDQFISVAGAGWAIQALTRALGEPVEPRQLALSEVRPPAVEPWVETTIFGSVDELKGLLDRGLSPDAATANGKVSLLMLAVPDAAKVKLLLDRGANVNARSQWKYSALLVAAQYRESSAAIRLLLERGAQVRLPAGEGTATANGYPMFFAAHAGNAEILPLLQKAGDALDGTAFLFGSSSYTPLSVAATYGHVDAVRTLLDLKAGIEGNGQGRSPLMAAIVGNRDEVVRLLIERGADVNRADASGMTPLHYAASIDFGDAVVADLLLKAGARADVPDKTGATAVQVARKGNNAHVLARLERR